MAARKADAVWSGTIQKGNGTIRLGSGAFEGKYSFATRFEDSPGTNPEELIAGAHAGCFSMALSAGLTQAGYEPTSIRTTASVNLVKDGEGFAITRIDLECEAEVPNLDEATFQQYAEGAKKGCPISKALAAVPTINLNARLKQ